MTAPEQPSKPPRPAALLAAGRVPRLLPALLRSLVARASDYSPCRTPRLALALASTFAALGILALAAPPALAAGARQLDTELTGQTPPDASVPGPLSAYRLFGVAVDTANDHVWIAAGREGVGPSQDGNITAYDAAGGFLAQLSGTELMHIRSTNFAVDDSNESIAVVSPHGGEFYLEVFDSAGELVHEIQLPFQYAEWGIAIDNSGGATQGRIYVGSERINAYSPLGAELPPEEFEVSSLGSWLATGSHGDIYANAVGASAVSEFGPSGESVRELNGAGAPPPFQALGTAEDPSTGDILIDTGRAVDEFSPAGAYLGQITGPAPGEPFDSQKMTGAIAVNSAGYVYVVETDRVDEFLPLGVHIPEAVVEPATEVERTTATLHAKAELSPGEEVTECRFEYIAAPEYHPYSDETTRYSAGSSAGTAPCLNEAGEEVGTSEHPLGETAQLHAAASLTAGTGYHYRLTLADAAHPAVPRYSSDETLETSPAVPQLKTGPATEITNHAAVLNASFLAEESLPTEYFFEYGTSTQYGHKSPVATFPGLAIGAGSQPQSVGIGVEALAPGTTYHYRVIAVNEYGTTLGEDVTVTTDQGPTIEGISTSEVTATSAVLHAKLNPQGFPTTYRFSYGPTTAYGQTAPQPEAEITGTPEQLSEPHAVTVPIEGLQSGVTYHFRLIAENQWEAVTSEDHSVEFFPPSCPNSAVRQQTGSAYLPDCRAYELVSPANANATIFAPGGPATGQATSPSRFSYTGIFSSLPGTNTIETAGDLYLATRTDTGWVSRYIGLPGDQAGCMGGPPTDTTSSTVPETPAFLTNTVLADPSMSKLLDWVDGTPNDCQQLDLSDAGYKASPASTAPYLWSSEGALLDRLPTDLGAVPGAEAALQCTNETSHGTRVRCAGETTASGDLSRLFFSSNKASFAEAGLTRAPGSAYEDDLATGAVAKISLLPDGDDIPQDPAFASFPPAESGANGVEALGGAEEFLRFPAVSTDGSHVLISTATGYTECGEPTPPPQACAPATGRPSHLYMRVGGGLGVTYEIAADPSTGQPAVVDFLGMTPDGSEVFFTSEAHLTGEDEGHSGASLYMWSAAKAEAGEQPLTLLSKAAPGSPAGAGDTAACSPPLAAVHQFAFYEHGEHGETPLAEEPWTSGCGIRPISTYPYSAFARGSGGNGITDTAIASQSGEIYFYSPEQLDGDRGVPGRPNLYLYREGRPRYVATFSPERTCIVRGVRACVEGPIVRIEVTPDGAHMAFLTRSRLTSYDNAGHLEMYSYTPATETLTCDSCNPSGRPATADTEASQDGLFLTEDGRVFFSTTEALVPADTNEAEDVYEFVDGRPQLITPGTGIATPPTGGAADSPGLVGVSANGTDVFFSTHDTLLSEDQNGDFLKFYDARTDGGFPQPPPVQPCAAAEECHGPGTEPPVLPAEGAAADLTGGNATPAHHPKHHKKKHKVRHERIKGKKHKHRAKHNRKGSVNR